MNIYSRCALSNHSLIVFVKSLLSSHFEIQNGRFRLMADFSHTTYVPLYSLILKTYSLTPESSL